jgi:hypothetical protein
MASDLEDSITIKVDELIAKQEIAVNFFLRRLWKLEMRLYKEGEP